jgi:protein-disulfide isomerase
MDEHTTPQQSIPALQKQTSSLLIPLSIIIGFGLIAAAIFFSGSLGKPATSIDPSQAIDTANSDAVVKKAMRAVDENDHIRGNPNAPILIVEYSDFDCVYCKKFHETMNKVMDTYGAGGKVAWVYRQFPVEQLHPSAPRLAQASECVAKLGGNDAFWKFADLVFGERATNELTNMTRLNEFAVTAGVGSTAFDACLEDGSTQAAVEEDFADGVNIGIRGTPYSVVLVGGKQGPIEGAQEYQYVSSILDTLIGQIEGKTEGQ